MKILFYNIQYASGINKGGLKYFLSLWRYLFSGKSKVNKLKKFIEKVDADVLAVDEIDDGSLRTLFKSQVSHLSKDVYLSNFFKCKYSNFFKYFPIFKKQGNAVFSKQNFQYRAHRMRDGVKDLMIEAEINKEVSIFLVHLALGKTARAKQLEQMSDILKQTKKEAIILGDFNASMDDFHMNKFVQDNNLTSANTDNQKTFPAWKPKHELDHFLVSSKLKINAFKVFENVMSDHLPVMLDCTLHNESF